MTRLWLLDFDGTLVDSEQTIKACYIKVGLEFIPERSSFIENMVIGPTLDESSRMILTNKNLHLLDAFKNRFQQLYDEKLVLETLQYPKVDETLKQLHANGDHLCILTNKRAYPTQKLIDYYGWNHLFKWVACMNKFPLAKNKSDLITLKNISQNQYDGIFFVGDTLHDGMAAEVHNIPFILAQYGYGQNQDWNEITIFKKIAKFSDILTF